MKIYIIFGLKSSFLLLVGKKRRRGFFGCPANLLKTLEIVIGMACNPVPFSYVKYLFITKVFFDEYG